MVNKLVDTLTQSLRERSYVGKLETLLTCQALAKKLEIKLGERSAEEIALVLICQTLMDVKQITNLEIRQFIKALLDILSRPFPICENIRRLVQSDLLPDFDMRLRRDWYSWPEHYELDYIQKLLRLIK